MIWLLTGWITLAYAGGWTSSGGNSVVCLNPNGQVQSAELFDLFEGRVLWGWQPQRTSLGFKVQAKSYLLQANRQSHALLKLYDLDAVDRHLNQFMGKVRFLPDDAELVPVDDANSPVQPAPPCRTYQTALYRNDGFVYINGRIWNAMSETDRAGLILHEIIYVGLREAGESDSVRTRKLVAALISGQPLKHAGFDYPNSIHKRESCSTELSRKNPPGTSVTRFDIAPINTTNGEIAFSYINGRMMLDRTSIPMPLSKGWPISERSTNNPLDYWSDGGDGPLGSIIDPYLSVKVIWLPDNPLDDIRVWIDDPIKGSAVVYARCSAGDVIPGPEWP